MGPGRGHPLGVVCAVRARNTLCPKPLSRPRPAGSAVFSAPPSLLTASPLRPTCQVLHHGTACGQHQPAQPHQAHVPHRSVCGQGGVRGGASQQGGWSSQARTCGQYVGYGLHLLAHVVLVPATSQGRHLSPHSIKSPLLIPRVPPFHQLSPADPPCPLPTYSVRCRGQCTGHLHQRHLHQSELSDSQREGSVAGGGEREGRVRGGQPDNGHAGGPAEEAR